MAEIQEQNIIVKYVTDVSELVSGGKKGEKAVKGLGDTIKESEKRVKEFGDIVSGAESSQKKLNQEANKSRGIFSALRGIFGSLADRVKSVSDSFKSQLTNIVGLGRGLRDLGRVTDLQKQGIDDLARAFGGGRAAILAVVKGLNVLKVALIATGIGAFVVLLGSLVAFLGRTQRGMDLLERATSGVGAVFDVISDRAASLIDNLRTATSVADGFRKAFQSFTGIGAEIAEEVAVTDQLVQASQQLEKNQLELRKRIAESRAEIKALNLVAEDTTKSATRRAKAAQDAFNIEKRLLAERLALVNAELFIQQSKNSLGESTNADIEKEVEIIEKRSAIVQESLELQTTLNNKLNSIRGKGLDVNKMSNKELEKSTELLEKLLNSFIDGDAQFFRDLEDRLREFNKDILLAPKVKFDIDPGTNPFADEIVDRDFAQRALSLTKEQQERLASGGLSLDEISDINDEFRVKFEELELARLKAQKDVFLETGEGSATDFFNLQKSIVEQEIQLAAAKNQRLLDLERELQSKRKDIQQGFVNDLKDFTTQLLQNDIEAKDKQIEIQNERIRDLRDIADQGNSEELQAEERKLAQIEQERADSIQRLGALQKAARQAEILANTFATISYLQLAAARVAAETGIAAPITVPIILAVLSGIIQTVGNLFTPPSFFKGTEDTGTHGQGVDGKGGFYAINHPKERILTRKQNEPLLKMGVKNEDIPDLVNLGLQYKRGQLNSDLVRYLAVREVGGMDNSAVNKLVSQNKQMLHKQEQMIKVLQTDSTTIIADPDYFEMNKIRRRRKAINKKTRMKKW